MLKIKKVGALKWKIKQYLQLQFKKDGLFSSDVAFAYIINKDGTDYAIIAIPESYDSSSALMWSTEGDGILNLIMAICTS